MIRFGIIGTGWRAKFFLRVAHARPDLFDVVGVLTRDIDGAIERIRPYEVLLFESLDELLRQKPLYVVTSLPSHVNVVMLHELADKRMPVLSETPPARSLAELEALYIRVQNGAKIAVAEQYHLQPHHAVRINFAQSGKMGDISQAQVSVAHGYHGISLMRRLLGIRYEDAIITARQFVSPIIHGLERTGLPEQEEIIDSTQTIAQFDFGDKLGIFDFCNEQYRSFIRKQRILVRGVRGELMNDRVIYLEDYRTPIQGDFERRNAGESGNLEGYHLKGIQLGADWVYHNPLAPASLNDEDIAIGECMLRMADYVDGAEAFYSLAEACQDQYLNLMMQEALESGTAVTTKQQIWTR